MSVTDSKDTHSSRARIKKGMMVLGFFVAFLCILLVGSSVLGNIRGSDIPESVAVDAVEDLNYTDITVTNTTIVEPISWLLGVRNCDKTGASVRFTVHGTGADEVEQDLYVCAGAISGSTVLHK